MAPSTERLLFPASGFTTKDAAAYYRKVAKWLLPHLKGVPLSIRRFPATVAGTSFWEKDVPGFAPPWIRTISVPRKSGQSEIRYIVANDVKTLVWLAESGGVELHTFLHKAPRLDHATAMVFDLDPGEGSGLADCCRVALLVREQLEEHGLRAYAKVSGSKGLQVYVPIGGTAGHPTTEAFSKQIAQELTARYPKLVVAKMAKQLRAGRVFIDWSQNSATKTTVAVYSLRRNGSGRSCRCRSRGTRSKRRT
jgi:bifunctional non-homologous end joining protein LigD